MCVKTGSYSSWCHQNRRLCSRPHSHESDFSYFWHSYFLTYGQFVEYMNMHVASGLCTHGISNVGGVTARQVGYNSSINNLRDRLVLHGSSSASANASVRVYTDAGFWVCHNGLWRLLRQQYLPRNLRSVFGYFDHRVVSAMALGHCADRSSIFAMSSFLGYSDNPVTSEG